MLFRSLVMSVWFARATGGLSLALFIALALRSVGEVPLLLFGYGPELLTLVLLLMTLASASASTAVRVSRPAFTPPLAPRRQHDPHLIAKVHS